jgi:YidC/Oxa1 family membrane protein insertase
MNKRFFLALLLTGAVIVLTPILFQQPGRVPVSTPPDSLIPPVTPSAAPAPPVASTAQQTPAPPVTPDTGAKIDTSLIITEKLRLRFSSLGASLVGAELPDYRILGGDSGTVELARPGEALLRFHAVAGADTFAIDRGTFVATLAPNEVTFRGTIRDLPAEIRYSFAPDTYRVKIGKTDQPIGYIGRVSVNLTGAPPGTFLLVDLPPGFRATESDSASEFSHLAYAFKPSAAGADLVRFGSLDPGEPFLQPGPIQWAVAKSKYFLIGILADPNAPIAEVNIRGVPQTGRLATSGHATAVIPLKDGAASFETYIGPQDPRRLPAVGREFETANPYGGWMQGVVQPFARIVMKVLLWVKDVTGLNYGYTLILFGVMIRVVLWPLNQMAMRSSLRMQRVQPELAAAQKKHAKDPEKQRDEMMRIYREHGMSPLSPLSGCLPMLIPMPVLFALFFVFQNTIEFRGVGFWWMPDISQFDPLFIIPAAMVISMFALQWIGMRNAPPNPQAKMMLYVLPIMMGVFLFKFAAGLNLYYAAQNIAALPQQWLIANERAKKVEPRDSAEVRGNRARSKT